MTAVTFTRLTVGDVSVGDELPELAYPVTATTVVLGALAARDWRPMHHDKDFAVNRNGTQDIFLNTPNQAAWFERYLTDWTGPHGRLGRVTFRMKGSVFPGDTMVLTGLVEGSEVDDTGCGFQTSGSARDRYESRRACRSAHNSTKFQTACEWRYGAASRGYGTRLDRSRG